MSYSFIPVPSATAGYNLHTEEMVVSGTTVHAHYFIPIDSSNSEMYFNSSDVTITGMPAVSGTVNAVQSGSWGMDLTFFQPPNIAYGSVEVGTSVVEIIPATYVYDSIEITNNSDGILYASFNPSVSSSGTNAGTPVTQNGCWMTPQGLRFLGPVYGIYSKAATTCNVSWQIAGTILD